MMVYHMPVIKYSGQFGHSNYKISEILFILHYGLYTVVECMRVHMRKREMLNYQKKLKTPLTN